MTVQDIGQASVHALRASLLVAAARTARAGLFSAGHVAAALGVPDREAGRWLDLLAVLGLLARYPTAVRAYACQPQLVAAPAANIRPLDEVSPSELWAAVATAQLPTGAATAETIAALLDSSSGRVDRVDLLLRLAALSTGGRVPTGLRLTDSGWTAGAWPPPTL
ncbi:MULTISPECIES: hypothetical protein [Frankia]|uniref:Uncharacterized protein n=1 Tax=Frankia alni (strain DSM 45986 / CECT 9034 / ACN14a) TaxID=326424 RepID=Q0RM79_FRAAA|nr:MULTISPECIES: hypothetical protein [Frankia]CAJ61373.1 hypothetical protein; putative ''Winged helix'' DNA-binding domain [Frankia alni ACN14a]